LFLVILTGAAPRAGKLQLMITVSNRIPVRPEFAEAFENRFRERLGLVDQMPGFLAYRLLRPSKPEHPYVVLTFWESEEHFRAWTSSAEFREQHKQERTLGPEAFAGPVQLEVHQVVQESGQVFAPR
jgi:heme-degrading monooxygenase HmoA